MKNRDEIRRQVRQIKHKTEAKAKSSMGLLFKMESDGLELRNELAAKLAALNEDLESLSGLRDKMMEKASLVMQAEEQEKAQEAYRKFKKLTKEIEKKSKGFRKETVPAIRKAKSIMAEAVSD